MKIDEFLDNDIRSQSSRFFFFLFLCSYNNVGETYTEPKTKTMSFENA